MKNAGRRGFTLIEVLTVIAVLMIVAGMLVRGGAPARDTIALDQNASAIADLIRTARQNSITVVEHNGTYPSYGVTLTPGINAASPGVAILFARTGATADGTDACYNNAGLVTQHTFSGGVYIESVTLVRASGGPNVTIASDQKGLIMFIRPLPTTIIMRRQNDCAGLGPIGTGEMRITLRNANGDRRMVTVNTAGNVTVTIPTP